MSIYIHVPYIVLYMYMYHISAHENVFGLCICEIDLNIVYML